MSESMTYIACDPCGCLVWAHADTPDDPHRMAREIAKIVRDGYAINRATTQSVREMDWRCHEYPACPLGQRDASAAKALAVKQEALL